MDIRSINNKDSFIDRTKRTDKSEKGELGSSESASKTNRSEQADAIRDNLELSRQKFADDIQYARQALDKLKRESGARLREIKQKIRSNDYDTAEIHNKVSDVLSDKMAALESNLRVADGETAGQGIKPLDQETIQKLTENDQVLSSISDRILNDLTQL
jgi:Spy/CpxP family protein refolding chaperone